MNVKSQSELDIVGRETCYPRCYGVMEVGNGFARVQMSATPRFPRHEFAGKFRHKSSQCLDNNEVTRDRHFSGEADKINEQSLCHRKLSALRTTWACVVMSVLSQETFKEGVGH